MLVNNNEKITFQKNLFKKNLRLEKAKKYAKSKGGICHSNEYNNGRGKLEWSCSNSNHPHWFSSFNTVINKSSWCPECGQ